MPSGCIDDLDDVDYIERVKTQQKNWIGRLHRRRGGVSRPTLGDEILSLHYPT